ATCWGLDRGGWVPYAVTVPAWLAATASLWALVPQARAPKLWGVPMVPWLPSASIAINVFLLGSIDSKSFMRFGIWTAALLVYYLFVGLHASYDTAKALAADAVAGKVEDGDAKTSAPPM
ncbi:Os03g0641200, partial [Oryza sativa Japonica Group]